MKEARGRVPTLWIQMSDAEALRILDLLDYMGLALADHNHHWEAAERKRYELAVALLKRKTRIPESNHVQDIELLIERFGSSHTIHDSKAVLAVLAARLLAIGHLEEALRCLRHAEPPEPES